MTESVQSATTDHSTPDSGMEGLSSAGTFGLKERRDTKEQITWHFSVQRPTKIIVNKMTPARKAACYSYQEYAILFLNY